MPHVAFVPLTGFRVREEAMRELGMTLPGLRERAVAIGQLPALGLLTLFALIFVPVPLIDLMGGIQLTDSETLLRVVSLRVLQLGLLSLPIWVVLARRARPLAL